MQNGKQSNFKYILLASLMLLSACKDARIHNEVAMCMHGYGEITSRTEKQCVDFYRPYIKEESLKVYDRCVEILGYKEDQTTCLSKVLLIRKENINESIR